MRIVKYNNNNVFPSLMNEFFNDDLRMNFFNRRHSVPSVNSVENNDSFEIDLAVPGMKKDDFTIELNDKILVISSDNSNYDQNERTRLNEFNYSSFHIQENDNVQLPNYVLILPTYQVVQKMFAY